MFPHLNVMFMKIRSFLLQLVSDGMRHHTDSLHVQLVATACVFNLTTLELVQGMPLHLLETVVQQLLTAVKNFPNYGQVHTVQYGNMHPAF